MATLNVRYYSSMPIDANGNPLPMAPAHSAGEDVVFTSGEASSAARPAWAKFARLYTDTLCRVAFADAAVATGDMILPAGSVEFVEIPAGDISVKSV